MIRIEGSEADALRQYFQSAADVAAQATCQRARCGSVIIKDGQTIGQGFNGPPLGHEPNRTCGMQWDYGKKPKYDLTCCIHAEWRSVLDASKRHGRDIEGSRLYFMRIDADGDFTDAGQPFCTVCSRLTMEAGVAEFALWNDGGADIYPLNEYDHLSYAYYGK